MKRWITLATLIGLVVGCVARIPLYSPRLPPTDEHRSATRNSQCLECHDVTTRNSHKATDDCRRCHTMCKEC